MQPVRDLAIAHPGRIELRVANGQDGDPDDVAAFERGIGRDVHPLDGQRPVETDAPECAMGLVAQTAALPFVQGHRQRRRAIAAKTGERQAAAKAAT